MNLPSFAPSLSSLLFGCMCQDLKGVLFREYWHSKVVLHAGHCCTNVMGLLLSNDVFQWWPRFPLLRNSVSQQLDNSLYCCATMILGHGGVYLLGKHDRWIDRQTDRDGPMSEEHLKRSGPNTVVLTTLFSDAPNWYSFLCARQFYTHIKQ
jgi:hypothetical protein